MGNFPITSWIILFGIAWVLYKALTGGKGGKPKYCKNCGHTGPTKSHTPGHMAIEIILWLCFIVPGLIYSIWRVSNRTMKCEKCESKDLVPVDSPIAIAAKNQNVRA